jgi:hypothetical protein
MGQLFWRNELKPTPVLELNSTGMVFNYLFLKKGFNIIKECFQAKWELLACAANKIRTKSYGLRVVNDAFAGYIMNTTQGYYTKVLSSWMM